MDVVRTKTPVRSLQARDDAWHIRRQSIAQFTLQGHRRSVVTVGGIGQHVLVYSDVWTSND